METIGSRIRFARERAKLPQSALARLVGVTSQSVTQWEAGKKTPGRNNLLRLAGYLLVTSDWLLKGGPLSEHTMTANVVQVDARRAYPMLSMSSAAAKRAAVDGADTFVAQATCSEAAYWVELPDDSNGPDFPRYSRGLFDPLAQHNPGDIVLAAAGPDSRPVVGQLSIENTAAGSVVVVTPRNSLWPAARSDRGELLVVSTMVEHTRILR
jgi:transcriptional regulator with XRE-family HTH domain